MIQRVPRIGVLLAAELCLVCLSADLFAQVRTQPGPANDPHAVPLQHVRELIGRLETVDMDLAPLKTIHGELPAEKTHRKVYTLLETPYLGRAYDGTSQGTRFFAAHVILVNLTPHPVALEPQRDVKLQANGESHELGDIPAAMQYQPVRIGDRTAPVKDLQPPQTLHVPSGKAAGMWVVFTQLPRGPDVPKLMLRVKAGQDISNLNVTEYARRLLKLDVQRIGPRKCLALLTIAGELNTVNAGSLVERLNGLVLDDVRRVVIRWTDAAAPLDADILNWLQQSAAQVEGGNAVNNGMPVLPTSLRELDLARVPNYTNHNNSSLLQGDNVLTPLSSSWIHHSDAEAVTAALATAYHVLPTDELLAEIEHGHRLSRVAAITVGGGRLPSLKLPLLLQFADDDDPLIQQAALTALRRFGEQSAIDTLLSYAHKNTEPLSTTAVDSLAASRYAAAHQALLQMLATEKAESQKRIVSALARHPRPLWAETIYKFAQDDRSDVAVEALQALARIGHPRLLDVLRQSLDKDNRTLQETAFRVLVSRTDPDSEDLALNYTLDRLKTSPPTPPMTALLNRTKDHRAVPLLLSHLDRSSADRTAIIQVLATVGDRSVAEALVKKYPDLNTSEQAAALQALDGLKSPEFRRLAGEALLTGERSLVHTASEGLQNDGSPEAVRLLAAALESSESSTTWSYVANALSTLATPQARAALRKALNTGNQNKRVYALNALRNLQRRSPGYIYVYQAEQSAQQQQWKQALAQFDMALKLDPQLSDAYSGRGHVLLKQNKLDAAKRDFDQAVKLDPYDSLAVTGTGICLAMKGKPADAVDVVEKARSRFTNDSLFAYNAACVYGRALEQVTKDETAADRKETIETYRHKAIADLTQSVKLGFRDFDFMNKDPDLNALHDLPEFQQLSSPAKE